jgi:hypothetical protein
MLEPWRLIAAAAGSALACLLVSACSRHLGTFDVLGVNGPEWPVMTLARGIEGRSCENAWLFGLLPVGSRASLEVAVRDAVGQVRDGQVLGEAVVELETWEGLLFRRQCVSVRGAVARRVRVVTVP